MAIWITVVTFALAAGWLWGGRHVTLLLDRLFTIRRASLPTSPIGYDGGGLRIGDVVMTFASTNNLRGDLRVAKDASCRMRMHTGGESFLIGPNMTAEEGDEVRFTSGQSLLPWPTTFEIRILGGHSPWWKRYVYYRLVWKKRSGARLDMFWRYEQQYYSAGGWTRPEMMWNSQTGLLYVKLSGQ